MPRGVWDRSKSKEQRQADKRKDSKTGVTSTRKAELKYTDANREQIQNHAVEAIKQLTNTLNGTSQLADLQGLTQHASAVIAFLNAPAALPHAVKQMLEYELKQCVEIMTQIRSKMYMSKAELEEQQALHKAEMKEIENEVEDTLKKIDEFASIPQTGMGVPMAPEPLPFSPATVSTIQHNHKS